MKLRTRTSLFWMVNALAWAMPAYADEIHSAKTIQNIQLDARPCVFFTLNGVPIAHSSKPASPWFALSKTFANYAEFNAMLLSAKLANRNITVHTTADLSCDYPSVTLINIDP